MDGSDVERAVGECVAVLGPVAGEDWGVPARGLEWTCWTTAAHVAHDLLAYAGQVAGRPDDAYLPFDLRVRESAPPAAVLRVITTCGRLLSAAVAAAGPGARGWHWGPADPGGFAALGVSETLLHTYDIAGGLGLDWRPPAGPAAGVLRRLFPDAPDGEPVDVLLWCTGRGTLPGRARRDAWVMRAAVE